MQETPAHLQWDMFPQARASALPSKMLRQISVRDERIRRYFGVGAPSRRRGSQKVQIRSGLQLMGTLT